MTHTKHVEIWRRPFYLVPFASSPDRAVPFTVIHAIAAAGVAMGLALALFLGCA